LYILLVTSSSSDELGEMISDNETPSCFLGSCLKLLLSFDLRMLQLRVIYYSILLVIEMDVRYKKMKIVC